MGTTLYPVEKKTSHIGEVLRAFDRTRTDNLRFTIPLLYQLSYKGLEKVCKVTTQNVNFQILLICVFCTFRVVL